MPVHDRRPSPEDHALRLVRQDHDRSPRLPRHFTAPGNYRAYVERTNEKLLLADALRQAYHRGELPIRSGDSGGSILDLGCGLGTNTQVLLDLFREHDVHAIDRSASFIRFAGRNLVSPGRNLHIEQIPFEDYGGKFDFVLCSHVLQYIDTDVEPFIVKIVESLKSGGEAWIVLQEEVGINQLVQAVRPLLDRPSPYLQRWFTHPPVREFAFGRWEHVAATKFTSHFRAPDMARLSSSDTSVLNFMLLGGFDVQNDALRARLSRAVDRCGERGLIPHEVGITKIRKRG